MKIPEVLQKLIKTNWTKAQIEKIILISVVVVVSLSLSLSWFLVPTLKNKRKLLQLVREKSEQLRVEERLIARKDKIQESINKLTRRYQELLRQVPQAAGPFSVLPLLNAQANLSLIVFDQLKPQEIAEGADMGIPGFYQKDYLVRFKAGYHQVGAFLNGLENVSPFIQVVDIKITGVPERPEQHDVALVLRAMRK